MIERIMTRTLQNTKNTERIVYIFNSTLPPFRLLGYPFSLDFFGIFILDAVEESDRKQVRVMNIIAQQIVSCRIIMKA